MVEVKSRRVEVFEIEKKGKPIVLGIKTCKSYKKALETLIAQQTKRGNMELEFYTRGLLELYNKFHPERKVEVELKRKRGKSSIEIIRRIDGLIIIKFQKDEDGFPQEHITEVNKEELQALIKVINELSYKYKEIPTKEIALAYCIEMDIRETDKGKDLFNGDFWERFFNWRSKHNWLCVCLSALSMMDLIEYKGGRTKLLERPITLQMIF